LNVRAPLLPLPLSVSLGFQAPTAVLTFAGAAPELVAGVFQINVRLDASPFLNAIYVVNGGETSTGALVYIKR
jgi:uncharacterized protein (TIGR03437 family)